MDDDDESIESLQILTDCNLDMLATQCKPLNISLNRLELDKNSIILVKDGTIFDRKPVTASLPEGEMPTDIKGGRQENCSNDTAETIKKIKEFIAMGRCDDTKKDSETSEKTVGYKPGPLSKKKDLALKVNQNVKISRLNMGLELERTLKGQDDFWETKEDPKDTSQAAAYKDCESESKVSDLAMKNNEFITPSRVSKRIQNKSVKFSVKKMLRGDDANVLKRMIPGYDDETPPKKERSTVLKSVKQEIKKVQQKKISEKSHSSEVPEEFEQPSEEENSIIPIKETAEVAKLSMESNVSTPEPPENEPDSPSSPTPPHSSLQMPFSSAQKASFLAEKLGKFASVTSGKITLELKVTPQKKVRIAIPPPKPSSPLPKTSLGPDIIIKRVRPVKKTVVIPENVKPTPKTVIEKEIDDYKPPISNASRVIKMPGGVNVERIPAPKSNHEIHQIHKTILRRGRPPKKSAHVKEIRKSLEKKVDTTPPRDLPLPESPNEQNSEQVVLSIAGINEKGLREVADERKKEDSPQDRPSLTQQITEALESTVSQLRSESDALEEESLRKIPDKLKGRKPSKLYPLSHIKSKVDSLTKKVSKPRKPDVVPEKSPPSSDIEEPEEKDFDNLFDKYFKTEERFIEHHDSLDSDSSEDLESEVYSHFINLRKHKENRQEIEKREDTSMFELMRDISMELPSWNIHVSSNGEIFYLAQIDSMEEKPAMKKVVEIDLQYNAKVYVNGSSVPEYEGNYNSYEDIKQLVYDIDQL